MRTILYLLLAACLFCACTVSRKLHQSAQKIVLQDTALQTAHVGISIYEPATGKWWYNWQGDKYFVPASNVKIATCYAAMKYLGDSLTGARFVIADDGAIELFPAADPTFLHPEFQKQPLFEEMKKHKVIRWDLTGWQDQHWGNGWSWNDYDAAYMAERSPFPVYGNVIQFSLLDGQVRFQPSPDTIVAINEICYDAGTGKVGTKNISFTRELNSNQFYVSGAAQTFTSEVMPMRMSNSFISKLLKDTLKAANVSTFTIAPGYRLKSQKAVIRSQPTDSLLKPMMHRSDNFFAEQSLLMVSNEVLGYMNDDKIIDIILKTDFADLPQKPRWADGSGLSRYNLFTPQDFVAILQKMQATFGIERLREVFPAGGEGTLSSFYKADRPYLYAKTGTLSGVVALSGYLTTAKGKELIVSVLVNNHRSGAVQVRSVIQNFLLNLRNRF